MKRFVSIAVLLAAAGAAHGADPVLAPIYEPEPVAGGLRGVVELGGLYRHSTDYDNGAFDNEVDDWGGYAGFALWNESGALALGIDGYGEIVPLDDENEHLTNANLGVLGAHAGFNSEAFYAGVFGAVATYPNIEDEMNLFGGAGGVEAQVKLGNALLFGRAGYAFAPNEDYDADVEGFSGPFAEAGVGFSLGDNFAVLATGGFGYSESFDVEDQAGLYANWGAKVAYSLPTDFALALVASYDGLFVGEPGEDAGEDDANVQHTFKLGLAVPFGNATAIDALRPLASPTAPFRASTIADEF